MRGKLATMQRRARGSAVNTRRVAALLRELADAMEQPDPAVKQPLRKRPLVEPTDAPTVSATTMDRVRRGLRKRGVAV